MPNTYDTIGQNQHQDITTFNIAPGYSRVVGLEHAVHRERLRPSGSRDVFPEREPVRRYAGDGQPGSDADEHRASRRTSRSPRAPQRQVRRHDRARRNCMSSSRSGSPIPTDPAFADERRRFRPAFAPFDLTSGGSPFAYDQSFTIKQQAAYVQDDIKAGNATFKLGLRLDHYDGLTSETQVQPRLGVSYAVPRSGTVLRASYGRTMETPYNENLLLSAGYGLNGLFGDGQPVPPGTRNQVEFGVQQGFGRWVVVDFGYFNKHTDNGYDFGVLFNTPIAFPVAWDHSRIDGFTGRVNLVEHHGFSAFVVMAHTNAIYSPPGVGGILLEQPQGDFRIDHDQKFNATTNLQYVFEKTEGHGRRCPGATTQASSPARSAASRTPWPDCRSAGGDRLFLRRQICGPRRPAHSGRLHDVELRCDAGPDSGRGNGGRCEQIPPRIAPATCSISVSAWTTCFTPIDQTAGALQRAQSDESGGALQLLLDVQRHALRHTAGLSSAGRRDVLMGVHWHTESLSCGLGFVP